MTNTPLTILLIEDNLADARFLQELLTELSADIARVVHVDHLSIALRRLREEQFDVLLLDFFLPDSQGVETLNRIREHAPDVPIIVMTGLNDEAIAQQMVQAGAQGYIVKGHLDGTVLLRTLRDTIACHQAQ
jgi:CheY-like chemotaxis protein